MIDSSSTLTEVSRHLHSGRFQAAEQILRDLIRSEPDQADAWCFLGIALGLQNQFDESAKCLRRAVELRPDSFDIRTNFGIGLLRQGYWEEARASLLAALALKPDHVVALDALGQLGHCFREQARHDEALACYEEALRLRPSSDGHNHLAVALTDVGRLEEAADHFRAALGIQPDYLAALCGLGELALHGGLLLTDQEAVRVTEFLASDRPSPRERVSLHLLQAGLLDRQGRFPEAFAHYRQSNELRGSLLKAQGQAFDADRHDRFVDELIGVYDGDYFRRVAASGVESDLPVFIVGMPRSGTSLVEQILASHPRVFGGGERKEIRKIASALAPARAGGAAAVDGVGGEVVRSLAAQYLQRLTELGSAALRVTDKLFDNYLNLGVIFTLIPRARVIHCRRQALDVCFSCYTQDFRGLAFSTSLQDLGRYHRAYARLMAHWRAVLPQALLEMDYEELVANQEAESRRLVAFCGLDWDERCLAFHANRRAVLTASRVQIRRPIYTDSVGRWKNYEPQLKALIAALAGEDR
jgi:tetratricopeptide (TPR) repeat protein